MPQLPSGRHVGLDPSPVDALWKDALQAQRVHQLMDIESVDDLLPFVDVIYFRDQDTSEDWSKRMHEGADQLPPRLEPYPSGFNLLSIPDELVNWSAEDQAAFQVFVDRARSSGFLDEMLARVQEYKKDVAENGHKLARLLAAWWRAGVHPLQPGGMDP